MTKKDQYRDFCLKEKSIPLFSQAWHLDAVAIDGYWEVALVEKGGEIAASMPYFIKKSGPFKYITMPFFTRMMGPYLIPKYKDTKHEYAILKSLIEQLPKLDFFVQNFNYNIRNWMPFYWEKYEQTTLYSYVFEDLSDLEKIYNNFFISYRNNKIPKARKQVTIKKNGSLEDFYRVNKMTFDRQGIDFAISFDFLKKYDAVLEANQARTIFFAEDDQGQIHSVVYLVWDKERAYYHLAGDDPNLRSSGAGILLVWEVLQYTKNELGLNIFDFEGSMIPGIEKVRRNFGAKPIPYFRIQKYHSKTFHFLQSFKQFIKR